MRGAAPTVTLTLPSGEVKFKAGDVPLGEPKTVPRRPGARRAAAGDQRAAAAGRPKAEDAVQDDYPAFWVRYKTGKQYLAWVAYQKEKDRVLLAERDGPDGDWSEPVEVAGPGDHFRVALAGTHNDTLWVVWASQRDHNWDLYGRPYKDGKLGDEVRLTDDAGPGHLAPHDHRPPRPGLAGLAGLPRRARSDIFARCADGDGWHDAGPRQRRPRPTDWNPVVAADYKEDRVWVGWDTYETGDYGVRVRALSGGPSAEARRRADAGAVAAVPGASEPGLRPGRPAVGRPGTSPAPNWGKDTGFLYQKAGGTRLYQDRQVRVKCLVDGKWQEPRGRLRQACCPPT